jgi:hypothetical protein
MARLVFLGTTIGLVLSLAPDVDAQSADTQGITAQGNHDDHDGQHAPAPDSLLVRQVQNVTRWFFDPEVAKHAGYIPFLGCVSGTQEGAMGVHYVNGSLVDGELNADQPEALMFETRNGKPHLLGVEYIVIAEPWDTNNPLPPALLGQVFTYNTSPNRYGLPPFYALHVWAWRENPHGTFVDWNPKVSCDGVVPLK